MAKMLEPFEAKEYDISISAVADEMRLAYALESRYLELYYLREPWEELWRELFAYMLPEREFVMHWFENGGLSRTDGAKGYIKRIGQRIHDSTAPNALLLLAAGIQGYVVSQQERWFRLNFPHPAMMDLEGARLWLQETEEVIYDDLNRSNFYGEISPLILDSACSGTASQRFFYDDTQDRAVYTTMHPIEILVDENHLQEVDTVFRVFRLNKRQALQHFGPDKLSARILKTESVTESFTFLHAVFPRGDTDASMGLRPRDLGSVLSTDAPYISVYKELKSGMTAGGVSFARGEDGINFGAEPDKILSVGGFREFPYAVWRWDKDTLSKYGTGPGRRNLPQVRQLNHFAELLKTSAHLAARPPYNVPSTLQGAPRLTPHGYNYYTDPAAKIEPILNAVGQYPIGKDREEVLQNGLRESFGIDFFLLISNITATGASKTATEVMELQSEKAAVLASVMRRMGPEYLERVLDWNFHQAMKRDRLPPVPDALREYSGTRYGRLKVDYVGPLAQAQKRLATVQGPLRVVQSLVELLTLKPDAIDVLDIDEIVRMIALDGGMQVQTVRSIEEVQRMRQIAAQRAAQQQFLEDQESAATAHRNFAMGDAQAAGAEGQAAGGGVPAHGATVLPMPAAR